MRSKLVRQDGMNNLARIRELRGYNQRQLAELIGVTQPTIQRAETEADSAKLSTYKACAEALGTSLAAIFSDRSDFEEEFLSRLRDIPEDRRQKVLDLLSLAEAQPRAENE